MRSKVLVRVLIVLLAAVLVYRIHQRVETYRIPRELCRMQLQTMADANITHMFNHEGVPAPSLDSLAAYAVANGFYSAEVRSDSVIVSYPDGTVRALLLPDEWKALWDQRAFNQMESELDGAAYSLDEVERVIGARESELGFSLDSLMTLRETYVQVKSEEMLELAEEGPDTLTSPEVMFDDSVGFDAEQLLADRDSLSSLVMSLESDLALFHDSIAPARRDSVSALAAGVCPTLWSGGYYDSLYNYDPKLALGTQFSVSCPNHERHGGVVGGLVESDFPDTLFSEADWAETQTVYPFEAYEQMRRTAVSRSNLLRAAEEQAAYLAQRYPLVLMPKDPTNLDVNIDELNDPLGGEYVFEVDPDTTYVFYENPEGRTPRARGDSIEVETYMFLAYTTADPDTSRVEVFFSPPLEFPSRAEGATAGANDMVSVKKYWDRSELGTVQVDEREVDLLDDPTWVFLQSRFGDRDTTETE